MSYASCSADVSSIENFGCSIYHLSFALGTPTVATTKHVALEKGHTRLLFTTHNPTSIESPLKHSPNMRLIASPHAVSHFSFLRLDLANLCLQNIRPLYSSFLCRELTTFNTCKCFTNLLRTIVDAMRVLENKIIEL